MAHTQSPVICAVLNNEHKSFITADCVSLS